MPYLLHTAAAAAIRSTASFLLTGLTVSWHPARPRRAPVRQ